MKNFNSPISWKNIDLTLTGKIVKAVFLIAFITFLMSLLGLVIEENAVIVIGFFSVWSKFFFIGILCYGIGYAGVKLFD